MSAVNYLWNPLNDNIVEEFDDAGSTVAEYTTEPAEFGNVVSQSREGHDSYFHYDGQGSTVALTDPDGDVTDTFAYSAFGGVTGQTGNTVNPYQCIGQKGYYGDSETGQYNVQRRTLDAAHGRWLSVDPLELIDGPNPDNILLRIPFVIAKCNVCAPSIGELMITCNPGIGEAYVETAARNDERAFCPLTIPAEAKMVLFMAHLNAYVNGPCLRGCTITTG